MLISYALFIFALASSVVAAPTPVEPGPPSTPPQRASDSQPAGQPVILGPHHVPNVNTIKSLWPTDGDVDDILPHTPTKNAGGGVNPA